MLPAQERPVPPDEPPLTIAFLLTGGLGDHVAAARFIRDLVRSAAPFAFDVYSSQPAVARWLFTAFPACRACYDEATTWDSNRSDYPLGLWLMQFVSIDRDNYSPTTVRRSNITLADLAEVIDVEEARYDLFVATNPRTDSLLARRAHFMGVGRNRISHSIAGLSYTGDQLDIAPAGGVLDRFELEGRRYVTVHSGYDTDDAFKVRGRAPPAGRSTRAYLAFDRVVALLKAEFRDVTVVQVGGRTSATLPHADVSLLNRTSIGETADVLRGAMLHIDSDGGLVHLATALATRCCVIFGPTSAEYFSYRDNINLPPPVCGDCWWTTDDWQTTCPRGLRKPQCLTERTPESVVDAIRPALAAALVAPGKRGLRELFGFRSGMSR